MARNTTKTGSEKIKIATEITADDNDRLKALAAADRRSVRDYLAILIEQHVRAAA